MKYGYVSLLVLAAALSGKALSQSEPQTFSSEQKKEIGEIMRQYLLDHPELIMKVAQKARAQKMEIIYKRATEVITKNLPKLIDGNDLIGGNSNGEVILVAFLDMRCGYCKKMHPILTDLIAKNSNLKVIYKDLAVLGPDSEVAAKALLAAKNQ